jgi:hypothetical protein
MNIVREMNNAQMNIDPETGETRDNEAIHNTHRYNLIPRLMTRNRKYAQSNNQLIMPKPHAHIIMSQTSIK